LPKNNGDWWQAKLARNVARDREKDAQLESMGWLVAHVWEHEDPIEAVDAIEKLWLSRRLRPTRRTRHLPLSVPCEILDGIVHGTGSPTQCSHEGHRPSLPPQRG
jgi:hypothetical protein